MQTAVTSSSQRQGCDKECQANGLGSHFLFHAGPTQFSHHAGTPFKMAPFSLTRCLILGSLTIQPFLRYSIHPTRGRETETHLSPSVKVFPNSQPTTLPEQV